MSGAYVESYTTEKGLKRYRVRARVRGRNSPLLSLGSFGTKKEADARADWARMELARGVQPDVANLFAAPPPVSKVRSAVREYLAQRVDLAERSRRTYTSLLPHLDRALGEKPIDRVTVNDVRELVRTCVEAKLGSDAIRSIRGVLAGAIDNAGVSPNPARDSTIRMPSRPVERVDVPPAAHVKAILDHLPRDLVVPVAVLEATGLRISELAALELGDIDRKNNTLRVAGKGGKVRIVPLPPELVASALASVEGTAKSTRIWTRATPDRVRKAVNAACTAAKIPHYSPHDLRHRYASRLVQQGVPVTQISAWLGHARTSMTHDTYAQVIADTEEAWRHAL